MSFGGQSVCCDGVVFDEGVHDTLSSGLRETLVVRNTADLVGVADNYHLVALEVAENIGDEGERLRSIGSQLTAVEVEEDAVRQGKSKSSSTGVALNCVRVWVICSTSELANSSSTNQLFELTANTFGATDSAGPLVGPGRRVRGPVTVWGWTGCLASHRR